VSLRGVPGVVVRDITDLGHPTTRCTITGGSQFQFVSATKVSYIALASGNQGAPGSVVPGWAPDMVKTEPRATLALLVKL